MKEFLIAFGIVAASIFGINNFGKINSKTQLSLSDAIRQCSQNIDANQCSIESVMHNIKIKSTSISDQHVLWNTSNQLINMNDGNSIYLNTTELNNHQLIVWNAYLADSKRQQRNDYMEDNNIFGIAIAIILLLVALWIFVALVPFVWRFLLRRISEVSKAVKGDKFD